MGERTTPVSGFTFRACSRDDTDLVCAVDSTRRKPGRFNTSDVGAVYVSREPTTAIEELRRSAGRDGASLIEAHPCSMLIIHVRLHDVLDLRIRGQMQAWALSADDLTSEDMRRCQEVAAAAIARGIEAIRWPSATGVGESLAVFLDRLRPESCTQVHESYDLTRDMLQAIAGGASVESLLVDLKGVPWLDTAGTCGASCDPSGPAGGSHIPPHHRPAGRQRRE